MKKPLITIATAILTYVAIYFLGQPWALRSEPLSRIWATVFHPLRLIQFRSLYSGQRHEQGTIQQSVAGNWSLTFTAAKGTTQGISFRVPEHLTDDVAAIRDRLATASISKEPDPDHFNCARYVLTAVAPVQEPVP